MKSSALLDLLLSFWPCLCEHGAALRMFFSSVEWMSSAFERKADEASMRALHTRVGGMGDGWMECRELVSLTDAQ